MQFIKSTVKLLSSDTSRDTFILFLGNSLSAVFGFVFIFLLTKRLSVSEFGIFSAAANLIVIISSLTDLGITTAMVNFISSKIGINDTDQASKYLKASFVIRFLTIAVAAALVFAMAPFVSKNLLSTSDIYASYWVALISIGLTAWLTFPYALMAYKKFWKSVFLDWSLGTSRILFFFILASFLPVNLNLVFVSYGLSTIPPIIYGFSVLGLNFLKTHTKKSDYLDLIKYSGWLGLNRIISSISGRLDIQMLALFTSASIVGYYSVASRLSTFVIVLASSLGSVLSTRFASFNDKDKEKKYLVKSLLFTLPLILLVVLWIFIAKPFVLLLFGEKYFDSVRILQYSLASLIPFILSTPAVTAIVHALRKPIYIGVFSIVQLIIIFVLNVYFISSLEEIGPSVTLFLTYTIMAIYSWIIVYKYYFSK